MSGQRESVKGGWGCAPFHDGFSRHALRLAFALVVLEAVGLVDNFLRDDLFDDICECLSIRRHKLRKRLWRPHLLG
jgi:hypothetical protein